MSNSLDPEQAQRCPNCLPRLSAYDTGRQRVKYRDRFFKTLKKKSLKKRDDIFLIFVQYLDCGYLLELRGF